MSCGLSTMTPCWDKDKKGVQRLVDIDKKMEEGKGKAYENWAKTFNIDQMGKTMSYMSLHGIKTYDQLNARLDDAENRRGDLVHQLNDISDKIREKKEFKKCVLYYRNYKELYRQWDEMKPGKRKDDFYNAHSAEIILFEAAMKYFKDHEIKSLPSTAKLQAEIDDLFEQRTALNPEYQAAKKEAAELRTVKSNIDVVTERPKRRDHSWSVNEKEDIYNGKKAIITEIAEQGKDSVQPVTCPKSRNVSLMRMETCRRITCPHTGSRTLLSRKLFTEPRTS